MCELVSSRCYSVGSPDAVALYIMIVLAKLIIPFHSTPDPGMLSSRTTSGLVSALAVIVHTVSLSARTSQCVECPPTIQTSFCQLSCILGCNGQVRPCHLSCLLSENVFLESTFSSSQAGMRAYLFVLRYGSVIVINFEPSCHTSCVKSRNSFAVEYMLLQSF